MGAVLRTVVFTLVVPGLVAVLIPYWLLGANTQPQWKGIGIVGLVLMLVGSAIYFWCAFWAFALVGKGTPAPMDPPRKLIVHGLYRFVRNPMYLGVGGVILGEALLFRSRAIAEYFVVWWLFVFAFVLVYEEPHLRRAFPADYEEYYRHVPRWIPRLTGYRPPLT
jgi:protein-S-isoprenylcysteine O-methyltransferase Ste14